MVKKIVSVVLFLFVLNMNMSVLAADNAVPLKTKRLQIKILDKAPVIDGELEELWTSATKIDRLLPWQKKKLTQKTEGFIGFYKDSLYMAFICWENEMSSIISVAKKNDSVIYGDDCIEIFLDTNNDLKTYYQVQINSLGIYSDKKCVLSSEGKVTKNKKWNAENLKIVVKRHKNRWIAEIMLPLTDLGVKWSPELVLGANFTRSEYPHREHSTWVPMGNTFHNPKDFGRLCFSDGAFIDYARVVSENDGIITIAARAGNSGKKDIDAAFIFRFTNPQVGETQAEVKFNLPRNGNKIVEYKHSSGYGGCKYIFADLIDRKTGSKFDACQIMVPSQGFKINEEFKTPHITWAKPGDGSKIKALFLLRYYNQRDIVELAQRIDLEYMSPIFIREFWAYPEKPTPNEYLEKVRHYLSKNPDVIVIGRNLEQKSNHYQKSAPFTADILETIKAKVKNGTGLIIYAQKGIPQSWLKSLLEVNNNSNKNKNPVVSVKKHFLTNGIPFASFNFLKLPVFDTENEVLAAAGKKAFLAVNKYGKGRIVILGYDPNGMIPSCPKPPSYRYWEYYFAFLTKCLYWAAGRNPIVDLDNLEVVPDKLNWNRTDAGSVKVALKNCTKEGIYTVKLTIRDKFSDAVYNASRELKLHKGGNAEYQFPLPGALPGQGLHFAEIIVYKGGTSVNWGIATFCVDTPLVISSIKPEKKYFKEPGEIFSARIDFNTKAGNDYKLKVKLIDRMKRVIGEKEFKVSQQDAFIDVKVPLHNPIWRSFAAEAMLCRDHKEIDRKVSEYVYYIPDRKLKEFACFVWNWRYLEKHPDYVHDFFRRRLLECGFNGIESRIGSLDMQILTGFSFIVNKHNHLEAERIAKQEADYIKTGDLKHLGRKPCLSDPESNEYQKILQKQARIVKQVFKQKPLLYHIGDENTITHEAKSIDFCFSPKCLKKFRLWLKTIYGSLDSLNKEWESDFKDWDEVIPSTKEQVLKTGNYAPWADHRHFMQNVFTGAYENQIKELHKLDPSTPVGPCGTRPLAAYSGIDWYKQLKLFSGLMPYSMLCNQAEVHRSFSDCPKIMATGLIKSKSQTYFNWKAVLNNCCGLIFSKVSYAVTPDLAISDKGHFGKIFINELTSGVGQIILNSKRDQGKIGIYYSPASAFVSWINEFRLGRKQKWEGPFHRSRAGWLKLIQDIGLQCRFVHPEQIKDGFLEKHGMKVLILPYSLAIGDDESAQITEFVNHGGTVIADFLPAVADWHGKLCKNGGLDELFGISGHMMKNDFIPGKVILNKIGDNELKGQQITSVVSGPEFKVTGGNALAEFIPEKVTGARNFPAVIRKETGTGSACYLNFLYDYHCTHSNPVSQPIDRNLRVLIKELLAEADVVPPLKITADGQEQSYTEVVPYESGKMKYYFILKDYMFPAEQDKFVKDQVKIEFPCKSYVYDVRKRKFLGSEKIIETNLKPGEAKAFAALPYEIKKITVTGPVDVAKGDKVEFNFRVEVSDGVPGDHIVRGETWDPAGNLRSYYCDNIVTKAGKGEFAVPLALNATEGKWKIKLTDIISGINTVKTFTVK